MAGQLRFLDLDEILAIHDAALVAFGGERGIRDRGLLESAVMQARATFGGKALHQDVFEMAAAYAFHLAQNQPFLDGNKRTALVAALTFLDLNGFAVDDADLFEAMIALADHRLDKAGLGALLRRQSTARKRRRRR